MDHLSLNDQSTYIVFIFYLSPLENLKHKTKLYVVII